MLYPLSDRQLENLTVVFGQGVKKRNDRRLAGNPADFVREGLLICRVHVHIGPFILVSTCKMVQVRNDREVLALTPVMHGGGGGGGHPPVLL